MRFVSRHTIPGLVIGDWGSNGMAFSVGGSNARRILSDYRGRARIFNDDVQAPVTAGLTGRGKPCLRGSTAGVGPPLAAYAALPAYRTALVVAGIAISFELVALACIRWRFFHTRFVRLFAFVTLGGAAG